MKIIWSLAIALLGAGCARSTPANNISAVGRAVDAVPTAAPGANSAGPPTGLDSATAEDAADPANGMFEAGPAADPNSAQAAAQLVERYFALIGQHRYAEARRLWGQQGESSNMSESAFAAGFAAYRDYAADVGAPGEPEGAAGSIYVEVPVRVHGRRGDAPFSMPGTVTLRRVNDVEGSTAAQRRWHIERVELQSRA